jgi:hypothetical protein
MPLEAILGKSQTFPWFRDPKQQLLAREVESLFSVRGGSNQSKIDGSLLCVKK